MKILQLCLRVPYPPGDGGNIAMYNLAKGLHDTGNEIHILAVNTPKHFVKEIPGELKKIAKVDAVFIDTKIKARKAFLNLFSSGSYNVSRFYSAEFENKLTGILKENSFDIIQMESLFVTPYLNTIRKFSKALVVLRAHNIEHFIWEKFALDENNLLKKLYLKSLTKKLKHYETSVIKKLDAIVAITEDDKTGFQKINSKIPIDVAPVGLDANDYSLNETKPEFCLFHLGSMDWLPNIEGVNWFLDEVWPLIENENIKLFLAGRKMPRSLLTLNKKNIITEASVDNSKEYIRQKQIMLVPLLTGGGMRVKIIEGMALGKTIISTTKGAEGINYTDGKNILIADTPQQFAEKIKFLKTNKDICEKIGSNARQLFLEKYSYLKIAEEVNKFYKTLLQ